MKKNILFINHSIRDGGPGRSLFYLLKHFDYEKFDVHTLLPGKDIFSKKIKDSGLNVNQIINATLEYAQKNLFDVVMLDTAGRQVVDQDLMKELIEIEKCYQPQETLLVADALTGQDAANVAKSFSEAVKITGSILTRIDGDSRGAVSYTHLTLPTILLV